MGWEDGHCYHADEEGKLLLNTIIMSQSYAENTSAMDLPGTLIIVIRKAHLLPSSISTTVRLLKHALASDQ